MGTTVDPGIVFDEIISTITKSFSSALKKLEGKIIKAESIVRCIKFFNKFFIIRLFYLFT